MDNQLRNLLLNNYEKSLPSKRDTEAFISNFHQYRSKKKAQEKTHFFLVAIVLLLLASLGAVALKETNNKLDIQTSSGVQK
jgi:hypothetical protein